MRVFCLVLVMFCMGPVLGYIKEKPSYLPTCYRSDPEFDKCSTEGVQQIFSKIKRGFPTIGILPLDPLNIPEVKLLQASEGPVAINASMVNVTITGLSNVIVSSNKVDFENYGLTTQLRMPRLRIEGVYTLKGRILVLPITGHGDAWLEPEDLDILAKTDVSLREEDGIAFFKVEAVRVNFTIGKLKLRLNNLYNGVKSLEDSTNEYLNNNWRPVADSLKPILYRTVVNLLRDILEKVFDNVPAKYFIADINGIS